MCDYQAFMVSLITFAFTLSLLQFSRANLTPLGRVFKIHNIDKFSFNDYDDKDIEEKINRRPRKNSGL